jgi:hypothetical protein
MKIAALALVGCASLPRLVAAQTDTTVHWPIAIGTRVRVLSPALGNTDEIGTALAIDADTLVFHREASSTNDTLSTFAIKRLDVSTGRHTWKAKGALIGFAIGVVGGAALGYATYSKPSCTISTTSQIGGCFGDFGRAGEARFDGAILGLLLAGTGAVFGAIGADTWTPVKIH